MALAALCFLLAALTGIWRIALIRGFVLPPIPGWWPPHGHLMVGGFLGGVIMFERILALQVRSLAWVPYAYILSAVLLHTGWPLVRVIHVIALAGWMIHRWMAYRKFHKYEKPLVESVAYVTLSSALNHPGGLMASPAVSLAALAFPVATIAVERLEMSLNFRRTGAQVLLWMLIAWLILWSLAAWFTLLPVETMGWLTLLLAAGMMHYDVALRTKSGTGQLQQFLRRALGIAYAWFILSGIAMIGGSHLAGAVMKDVLFHLVGLGFIFTMILAHAPLILPAAIGKLPPSSAPVIPFAMFQLLTAIRIVSDVAVTSRVTLWMWAGWITGALHVVTFAVYVGLVVRSLKPSRA